MSTTNSRRRGFWFAVVAVIVAASVWATVRDGGRRLRVEQREFDAVTWCTADGVRRKRRTAGGRRRLPRHGRQRRWLVDGTVDPVDNPQRSIDPVDPGRDRKPGPLDNPVTGRRRTAGDNVHRGAGCSPSRRRTLRVEIRPRERYTPVMFGVAAQVKAVQTRMRSLAALNLELAKLEGKQKETAVGVAGGLAALAAVLIVYAIGFVFAAIAAGLNEGLSLWLSLLIVAAMLLAYGGARGLPGVCARSARRRPRSRCRRSKRRSVRSGRCRAMSENRDADGDTDGDRCRAAGPRHRPQGIEGRHPLARTAGRSSVSRWWRS